MQERSERMKMFGSQLRLSIIPLTVAELRPYTGNDIFSAIRNKSGGGMQP